jgi:CRISP-associated protein Cas1
LQVISTILSAGKLFLDIKDAILEITPAERKRLGINRLMLWYQQKGIAEGKGRKIYRKVLSKLS